jgi:hypothetical protein
MSDWTNKNQLFINLPAEQLLTIVAYGEAGNQDVEGMMAVLNVIRNRTLDTQFYDTEIFNLTNDAYKAVALKKWQFSMFNLDDPVRAKAENWANNFQNNLVSNSTFRQAYDIAQMLVGGTLSDNTGGATFYLNPAGVTQMPQWASVIPFIGQIGDHLFFGEGVSAAIESVKTTAGEAIESLSSTFEETAASAVEVMKEYPSVTILLLAGIGTGLLLELRKRKK